MRTNTRIAKLPSGYYYKTHHWVAMKNCVHATSFEYQLPVERRPQTRCTRGHKNAPEKIRNTNTNTRRHSFPYVLCRDGFEASTTQLPNATRPMSSCQASKSSAYVRINLRSWWFTNVRRWWHTPHMRLEYRERVCNSFSPTHQETAQKH